MHKSAAASKDQNLPSLDRRDSDQIARMQKTIFTMRVTIDRIEHGRSIVVARWNPSERIQMNGHYPRSPVRRTMNENVRFFRPI